MYIVCPDVLNIVSETTYGILFLVNLFAFEVKCLHLSS